MSVGPMTGVTGSAAGAPLSQTSGSETERSQKDASANRRQVDGEKQAEKASGIGQTEQDQEASDRDADGHYFGEGQGKKKENPKQPEITTEPEPPRQAKDPSGISGNSLDLTG